MDAIQRGKPPYWVQQSMGALIFILLLSLATLGLMAANYGPGLARDLRLAGSWTPAPDLRAENGVCENYQFVLTLCSATLVSPSAEGEHLENTSFMMSFTRGGDEALLPMRSTRDPSAVAIGYAAQDELTNRTLSFAVYSLIFLLLPFAVVRRVARGQYKGGRAHRALAAGLAEIAGAEEKEAVS